VLRREPVQAQALYGLAMLAMDQGRLEEAISQFNAAVKAEPDFVEARRYRSIALARSSRWEQASRDVRWCLDREPGSGDTLYAAACVSSLAAGKLGTTETYRQSLDLLRRALDRGVGLDKFAADPDLKAIRDLPEFKRLSGRSAGQAARNDVN
jgi:eukaryotic-like serine/threonine-protein kinase